MLGFVLLFLNIGGSEMIFIFVVALFLFGGDKLPEIARGLGKGIRDFKDASEGVKREINNQINSYEEKRNEEALNKAAEEARAKEQATANEHTAATTAEENTTDHHAPATPGHTDYGVPNTMPYVEPNGATATTSSPAETESKSEETKTEPLNTTVHE